jgi:hypothetical protein
MSAASNMMMAKNHHNVGCEQHFFWQYLTVTGSSATIFGATLDCFRKTSARSRKRSGASLYIQFMQQGLAPRVFLGCEYTTP